MNHNGGTGVDVQRKSEANRWCGLAGNHVLQCTRTAVTEPEIGQVVSPGKAEGSWLVQGRSDITELPVATLEYVTVSIQSWNKPIRALN